MIKIEYAIRPIRIYDYGIYQHTEYELLSRLTLGDSQREWRVFNPLRYPIALAMETVQTEIDETNDIIKALDSDGVVSQDIQELPAFAHDINPHGLV